MGHYLAQQRVTMPVETNGERRAITLARSRLYMPGQLPTAGVMLSDASAMLAGLLLAQHDTPFLTGELQQQLEQDGMGFDVRGAFQELHKDIRNEAVRSHFQKIGTSNATLYFALSNNQDASTVCELARTNALEAGLKPRNLKKRLHTINEYEAYIAQPEDFHTSRRNKAYAGGLAVAIGVGASLVYISRKQSH